MGRLLIIPLALLLLLAGAMVWSGGAAKAKADFTFINRGEIGTLDPRRMSWLQDIRIGYALWEGLYMLDPHTLEAVPGTAGRIDISDDKTVYTFHIRPEARWSNGDDVVAGDFVFAWRRMLEQPGDYSYLLHYIKGAKPYQQAFASAGKKADFSSVGIKVIDDKTLRVTLEHPVAFFPDIMAFPPAFPLHERSMAPFRQIDENGRETYRAEFVRPPALVTNGPYRLKSWEFKRRLRLEASEHYWDRANVKSPIIDMVMIEDKLASYEAYNSGAVDWLAELTGDLAAELRAQGRTDVKVFPSFGTYFYIFNCQEKLPDGRRNPLHDKRVRQALTMAIDKQPIVDSITRLGEPVATTFIPPGAFVDYRSPAGLGFDVARARQLLAEAGFPGGANFPQISILYNKEMQHSEIAQYVRRQWLQNLNIDVSLEAVEVSIFSDRRHQREFAIGRGSWFGDYNDPSTFLDMYLSSSGNNDAAWFHGEYDALNATAAREPDAERRLRLFERAEAILLEEAPILPIYTYVNKMAIHDDVRGIPLTARNMVNFKSVYVAR